jgi:arylsulfatase A-like enzyme
VSASFAAGQYEPILIQDDAVLGVPTGPNYYFPDDLTDKAMEWLHAVRAQDSNKPWMMYYATGAAHAPHHVPKQWADRYKGRFDSGWDVLREEIFARQKVLGIIPQSTKLTDRPSVLPAWETLSAPQKQLYARQMEVYAGFQENCDSNIGRLLDDLEVTGELENTLVFYIYGDNGASMEGTPTGSFNEMTTLNGLLLDAEQQTELIKKFGGIKALGSALTAPHVSAAWAHALNTPFQWGKQSASHLGGTRNPLAVAWPKQLEPQSHLRSQFTHVNDIAPTVLDAANIPQPDTVDGVVQLPMDGVSFLYSFNDSAAPEQHRRQYFEVFGSRAMYLDGWWASSRPSRLPWDLSPEALAPFGPQSDWNPDTDVGWELYDLRTDFSQAANVASRFPAIVDLMQKAWREDAHKNQVFPLMGGLSVLYGITPPISSETRLVFQGDVQNIQRSMTPSIYGRSYSIEAEINVTDARCEGVIVANADFFGGYSLWVSQDRFLRHTYSLLGVEEFRQVSKSQLPMGSVILIVLYLLNVFLFWRFLVFALLMVWTSNVILLG